MGDKIKISVLEDDGGIEFDVPTERSLTSDIVQFDPTGTIFDPLDDDVDLALKRISSLFNSQTSEVIETIWAEENGGLSNNNRQWSFGNGSTGAVNIPAMYDCKIREMGLDAENVGTSVSINLMINNSVAATASFVGEGVVALSSEVTVNKGDFIGFQTNTEVGNYTDVRVAVALIQEVTGLKGEKGDKGDAGAGSDLIVENNDSQVGGITLNLNFEGNAVQSVVDEGSGKTTVTLDVDTSNFETSTQLDNRDTANRDRANHTGTQLANTISDFESAHDNLPSDNPHGVTKAQVGLGNVDNTSDVDKPLSTAQAQAITDAISNLIDGAPVTLDTLNELAAAIADDENFATTITTQLANHISDSTNPHNVTKAQVGLGNADNTSDVNKPVSTAQQAALDLKYNASNPSGFETPIQLNNRDTANRNRDNHTGTQLSATISNFAATVRSTVLTGISFVSSALVVSTDSILVAIGKIQAQLNNMVFGRNAQVAFTEAVLTTTSSTFINIQSITTPNLPTGRYLISASGSFLKELIGAQVGTRILIDATPHVEGEVSMDDDDFFFNNSSFYVASLSGVHTISYQFRKIDGAGAIQAQNRAINFWRID